MTNYGFWVDEISAGSDQSHYWRSRRTYSTGLPTWWIRYVKNSIKEEQ